MKYIAQLEDGRRVEYEAKSVRDAMTDHQSRPSAPAVKYWVSEYTTIHAPWNLLEDATYVSQES